MQGYTAAVTLFPKTLQQVLFAVSECVQARVQEIRLRAGQAVSLCYEGAEHYITPQGAITNETNDAMLCEPIWLEQTVDIICEGSLYAHQEELRRGFVTAANGCRVGVAGTALTQNESIVGYRAIHALCVRVAREHPLCAQPLASVLFDGRVHSLLLCGEPASGKTSILRDIVRIFCRNRVSVVVVDERGELSGNGFLNGCDVLRFSPKAQGVEQAIRCLAPQVVVFDELGNETEWRAVTEGLLRGVPAIASVHCRCPQELLTRAGAKNALRCGVFEYVAVLKGRQTPGKIDGVYRTEEWLRERRGFIVSGGKRNRHGVELATFSTTKAEVFGTL